MAFDEQTERKAFEEAAFKQRFMASIQPVKPGSFQGVGMPFGMPVDCPTKADFVRRNEDGSYVEESLNFAWWGWKKRAASVLDSDQAVRFLRYVMSEWTPAHQAADAVHEEIAAFLETPLAKAVPDIIMEQNK